MAEDGDEAQPRSMTLMAGTRINPTKVNELASKWPISWFEQTDKSMRRCAQFVPWP
jgi:poly(3-hydroxybutyrate) depolymerase